MQLRAKILQSFSLVAVAATLSLSGPDEAKATLVNGWNLIHIQDCYASSVNGIQFINIYSTTGETIPIVNQFDVGTAAKFCADGNAFYVLYQAPSSFQAFAFYPGLH